MSTIDIQQAQDFLSDHFRGKASDVATIGAGAWSQCFGFRLGHDELAIRFGRHVDDFQKDQRAGVFAGADLPIPQVTEIGTAFDGYYAISTRAHGVPLESADAVQWRVLVPAVAAALEAMRHADIALTKGIGGWGEDGNALDVGWREYLLLVGEDTPAKRTHGWLKKLEASPEGMATFEWGFKLLQRLASDDVPRSLLHCDLINRNVLVADDKIAGVFDWGCSIYGDHLYDLAWFEFWSPWFPEMDLSLLRNELERRWRDAGDLPRNMAERLAACHLHIGLDHLGYNAFTGDTVNLLATAKRMRDLVERTA
jgi:hygromycin-B 4-O-kinase